jgi:O-antigen ligase
LREIPALTLLALVADGASPDVPAGRLNAAAKLHAIARGVLWLIAFGIFVVIPWDFGGNGPEGYYWIVWSGRLCVIPLALWGVACGLRREKPGAEFWVPVICWGLLAIQVLISLHNPSHESLPPWSDDVNGFKPIPHTEYLPSTTFDGSTIVDGNLWLAFALLALSARSVGLARRPLRVLLGLLVLNAVVLSLIGIPFKFSGQPMMLGRWQMQEMYFYSTFIYHNHWCAYALLALASAVALGASAKSLGVRIALIFAGVIIAASAPLSTSRLGTLAMLVFGIFIGVTLLRQKFSRRENAPRTSPLLFVGVALAMLVVAGSAAFFYKARTFHRGDRNWSAILHSNPFGLRQTFVEDTLPMLGKKPIFGWGLGGFGAAFRFYQRAETRVVANEGRITLYDHIHNDWLERLAELGVIGFGLFVTPGVLWLRRCVRTRPIFPFRYWLLAGCVGVLAFALGDMAFVNNVVAASFGLLLGFSTGNSGDDI